MIRVPKSIPTNPPCPTNVRCLPEVNQSPLRAEALDRLEKNRENEHRLERLLTAQKSQFETLVKEQAEIDKTELEIQLKKERQQNLMLRDELECNISLIQDLQKANSELVHQYQEIAQKYEELYRITTDTPKIEVELKAKEEQLKRLEETEKNERKTSQTRVKKTSVTKEQKALPRWV